MLAPSSLLHPSHATVGELVDAFVEHSMTSLITSERAIVRPNGGAASVPHDVEDVHRFRVAARRLRSTLGTYRACWPDATRRMLRDELRAIGRAAGEVRDADVLAERLRAHAASLHDADHPALALLLARLHAERGEAHAAFRRVLASARHAAFRASLVTLVGAPSDAHPSDIGAHGSAPARFVPVASGPEVARAERRRDRPARKATKLVRASYRDLRRAVRAMERASGSPSSQCLDEPDDATLHSLRILAKRCRYAAESVSPLVGRRAVRFARSFADLQSLLGEHQDTVSAEAWLRRAVLAASVDGRTDALPVQPSAELVLLAGELIGLERTERARCRDAFDEVWRRVRRAAKRAERTWL